ncbi:DNA (cytosine-5-)-methyltransferase [Mobilitalea sibirica]|uniref:DNA (Cytosine-5-)-methyltransferase n=1 Tax=Mobilitalea sibirica TaxID=1462919 RepID=A0A8J7L007_9FIRM|nr:DNA (cytosine-5-)-methyltransferase [Mobilitalea sibirica]MBH1941343.1 DNA (cytosine-5-)-methyltransferase [Mobilitalea sibirica]
MATVKLKIAELRKEKGVGQQELAEVLGVSFQSVSKWETGTTMPDITLLPNVAEYFQVSVDELLGLKPLRQQAYVPRNTDNRDYWNDKKGMYKNRKYFWNDDYLRFLVNDVWKIDKSVNVIDFRCGEGDIGMQLLDMLPEGSSYTGVDNEYFTNNARIKYHNTEFNAQFFSSDLYTFVADNKYDVAISQVGLRHLNRPKEILKIMKASVKKGGLIVCLDVNREFEQDGLYIDGMDYEYLCTAFDFHKIWKKELECEGRDYAIGMRLPFYMKQLGLQGIDIRMNDRIIYVDPDMVDYEEIVQDFIEIQGLNQSFSVTDQENTIEYFMSRGVDRAQVEAYITMRAKLAEYFKDANTKKSFLKVQGLLVTYGRT